MLRRRRAVTRYQRFAATVDARGCVYCAPCRREEEDGGLGRHCTLMHACVLIKARARDDIRAVRGFVTIAAPRRDGVNMLQQQ